MVDVKQSISFFMVKFYNFKGVTYKLQRIEKYWMRT